MSLFNVKYMHIFYDPLKAYENIFSHEFLIKRIYHTIKIKS